MASTYTELIERLRSAAKLEQATCESEGIHESGHAKMLREAADAIETLSSGINVYADEACKRAQECADLRRRIEELVEKYEKEAADHAPAPDPAPEVLYICDRRKCTDCHEECRHTKDWRHAKHFEIECGGLWEQEG